MNVKLHQTLIDMFESLRFVTLNFDVIDFKASFGLETKEEAQSSLQIALSRIGFEESLFILEYANTFFALVVVLIIH